MDTTLQKVAVVVVVIVIVDVFCIVVVIVVVIVAVVVLNLRLVFCLCIKLNTIKIISKGGRRTQYGESQGIKFDLFHVLVQLEHSALLGINSVSKDSTGFREINSW